MWINIFTAPAIGLYLNRVRKAGKVEAVNDYLGGVEKELRNRFAAADAEWLKSPKGSTKEGAACWKMLNVRCGDIAVDIIAAILSAGEFYDSVEENVRKREAGKIKGKIQK